MKHEGQIVGVTMSKSWMRGGVHMHIRCLVGRSFRRAPCIAENHFAGVDKEAVAKAREFTLPYPPSSPAIALFKDGELVRSLGHASFDGVITNEATGEQFRDRNHFSIEIDYVANTYTFRGPIFQLHSVDGGPVLILDAGTITGDLDTGEVIRGSAKHPALFPNIFADYTDVLCEGVGA